ncbi:MAG TPA: histidine kinase dimerization/phospho-acceptor domain-containing protein, partial [Hyphomicrobiales bacterium]|nr:histidine kinase dimerization/phospho-acceptor domain-containing protein [Hyphomicrobiales bacterium]
MPLARFTSWWRTAFASAVLSVALLASLAGYSAAVLALFACLGTAAVILFAAGAMQLGRAPWKRHADADAILNALTIAAAVSDKKGAILWSSRRFHELMGSLGLDRDLSRLGEVKPELGAAIFRLFAAARKGRSHAEVIQATNTEKVQALCLKVAPGMKGPDPSLFCWEAEKVQAPRLADATHPEALNALPVPALRVSAELFVEGANRSFEKLYGGNPAGRHACSLFRSREGNPFTLAQLRETVAKAEGQMPVQVASPGGLVRPAILYSGSPGDGAADVKHRLWIVAPEYASENLAESFTSLLGRAPAPMALLNFRGIIQAANAAFQQLFPGTDNTAPALTGKPLASLVAPESMKEVRDKIAALSPSMREAELEVVLRQNRRTRLALFPVASESCWIAAIIDSGTAAMIEQAAQSQKLQAVGELAGGIAHDFNNLLTAIIGFADLLLRRFRASDPVFKDLMNIKNNAIRAAELVKQILAYSRRQTLRPALVKLTDVIEEFQATMGRTLGEKVKAKAQHGRDLWFVKADEGQLFQVIMNLA